MQVGDLVIHKNYKGSIGFIVNKATWPRPNETVFEVMWFHHFYDTGCISPVYEFEIRGVYASR